MSARCQEILERLVEATTGSLPPPERAGIAEHLAICERCRAEAVEIEAAARLLRDVGSAAPPPGFWAGFTDRLNARIAREREPAGARLRRWLAGPRPAWGALVVTAAMAVAISVAVRTGPLARPTDQATARARGLITDTMTTTLPSLGDLLETWRAGLNPDGELSDRAPR
jgi:anti-sigma factor RsiW